MLGALLATILWAWVAVIDAALGRPFHTFEVLGGVVAFTVIHYLLNILYAVGVLSFVHGASKAPSLMFGLLFGLIIFECGVGMLSTILTQSSLGASAWLEIFGGSVIGLSVAIVVIARHHPLAMYLRRAEEET